MGEQKIYTVSELTRDIRSILEGTFQDAWVEGEVSNLTVSSAGHAYFSLKDEQGLLNCVLFRGNSRGVKFEIESGMSVLCRGKISVYDKRGQYQLYVSGVEPRGQGGLQLAFEQLKRKLQKEGLFAEENKKPLPFLPARIGVVTSPTGAAVRDIVRVVRRRYEGMEITIRPVKVQGDGAAEEIARAIRELNEFNREVAAKSEDEHPIDVMIVGRGGGSLEDLWAFNEEVVVRAVFESEIPVVSAVGHEIDFTISDFVADLRAATPSAAAELVIPLREDLDASLEDEWERMDLAVRRKMENLEQELDELKSSYVLRAPMNVFLKLEQQVSDLAKSAAICVSHRAEIAIRELGTVTGKLQALSPVSVLDRGYSITFFGGKVVKEATVLKKGDQISTRLSKGQVTSRVEEVE
ncbi:MAG: exodeoxyribonuclease VII large subunit [Candidatus Tantalella remota]|nr:exodeoxyribonuclease VII large subunit [Candidatus Tantalella remota]